MNKQVEAWSSKFGVDYTKRNDMTIGEMDIMYWKMYGVKRSEMNEKFLGRMDRDMRILEVGANIGLQLQFLKLMGFGNLYGIEISTYAIELAKLRTKNVNIIYGNALDIPFKDNFFDLVFTSGVLIHINPDSLKTVMQEIYRCSKKYIWGMEYFADKLTQIEYRQADQTNDLLWKGNYPQLYCDQFNDLKVDKIKKYKVVETKYEDIMFLLRKNG
jgi:pseudaminic acid biosynthesis-associated methylase